MSVTPRLPPAFRLVALERVGSTNEEAKRLAAEGAEEGTLVWALEQTAGRGRRGRRWHSPRGNLYLSLVLRPDAPPAEAAQLGMVAAVAVGDALGTVMPPLTEVWFKWPNDILVNGRKAAGILVESAAGAPGRLDWLVLGVGVNVECHPQETQFPATSLHAEGGDDVAVAALLEAFSRNFLKWADNWVEEGFAPVRRAWLARAWRRGEAIQVRLDDRTLKGVFADLDTVGALLLDLPDGSRRRITAADVFALPVAV